MQSSWRNVHPNRRDPEFVFLPPEEHTFGEVAACNLLFLSNLRMQDWYLLTKRGFDILDSWTPNPKIVYFDLEAQVEFDWDEFCLISRLHGKSKLEKKPHISLWPLSPGHKFHCEKYWPACMLPKKGEGTYGPRSYRHPHPHPPRG